MKTFGLFVLAMVSFVTGAFAHAGHVEHGFVGPEHLVVLAGIVGIGFAIFKVVRKLG